MIEVSHLSKMYGPRSAIQDISFSVTKGEIVGFLGPNGAGKTTTMKILTGFMPASSGTASIAGHDVFKDPMSVKRNLGYLPETPPVYLEMTVEKYVEFAAALHEVPKNKIKNATSTAIEKTALGDVKNRIIGNLSKGYRQRVGLAQAIVHNPKVLILDEPTVGLDPKQIIEIRNLIKSFAGDHTVILSSHILPEVTATCQRIIVINKGKIVAQDTLEHLNAHLRKGNVYNLVVKTASAEAVGALKSIQGVADVHSQGNRVQIEIKSGSPEIRDQIIETAVKKGMGVLEFAAEKLSLEEVFLQLTTDESTPGVSV